MKKFWNDDGEQEVHLIGEYVGVAWNFDWVNVPVGTNRKRSSEPYICAWRVYDIDANGIGDVDEDGPLNHGMDLNFARQIHKELGKAIEYLEEMENK